MKLEKQLISLELAKRFKKLGIKQESLWWWALSADKASTAYNSPSTMRLTLHNGIWEDSNVERYSAFTVAELGEAIKKYPQPEYCLDRKKWVIDTFSLGGNIGRIFANTEANARAKCLIYLLENNPIKKEA